MTMKKITYYIGALCLGIQLTGCDDLLNVNPGSELLDPVFWKSESDLKGACNKLYYDLDGWDGDTRTDEVMSQNANSTSNGTRTVPGTSTDWTDPYNRINVANNILEKAVDAPLSEAVLNKYLAEAHFFRAYQYFKLIQYYGDVPLVLKVFQSLYDPDLMMPRTPREEVVQQCYKDLEYAAQWLPKRTQLGSSDLDRTRVSRSSALGLMVRIALYEGTFQKYHSVNGGSNANAHFDKAIAAFEDLKKEGHSLYPSFDDMFSYKNEGPSNPEIVFAKGYGPNDFETVKTGHTYTRDLERSYALTRNALDNFLYADGLPMEKSPLRVVNETSYNNVAGLDHDYQPLPGGMGERDPRLIKTIWLINDPLESDEFMGWIATGKGEYFPFDSQRPKGYPLKKTFFGSMWAKSNGSKDFTDKIIIRWGEMLISYAEALYERNGSITDAQLDETVNALRARVGFNAKLTNSFVTTNGLNMRDEIRRERYSELMGEGFRFNDIIRWKIAEDVLPKPIIGPTCVAGELQNPSSFSTLAGNVTNAEGKIGDVSYGRSNTYIQEREGTRKFNKDRDYLYPIPTFEIGSSDGNIKQNPGW
jgi:hypothetical protein